MIVNSRGKPLVLLLQHKCFKYWPSEGVLLAHSLSIVLQTEKTMSYYTIRTFKITLNDDVMLVTINRISLMMYVL